MTAIRANVATAARGLPWLAAIDAKAAAFLRALAFRPYAATFALIVLCCALYLPGIASLPVTDRDEARFAQASKQMLETGNYVDIRFQSEARYKKPIGIYWLQSAAVTAAKQAGAALDDIWAYRIPSFLGALGAVLLTWWAGRATIGRERAFAASALFAACLTLAFEARIAKSDAALIASIALAQGALFRLYMAPEGRPTRGLAALFWLGLGAGILIKGPVAPALALITSAVVLWRGRRRGWLKNLHWGWGVPLLLAVTLPWFIAIGIASHGEFFKASLGQDFGGKLQGGQEAHGAPPGYYFIAFWLTFWPAALFVDRRRHRHAVARPALAAHAVPPRLDRALVAPHRGHPNQASALCAAALPGHRHGRCPRHKNRSAFAPRRNRLGGRCRRAHCATARADVDRRGAADGVVRPAHGGLRSGRRRHACSVVAGLLAHGAFGGNSKRFSVLQCGILDRAAEP